MGFGVHGGSSWGYMRGFGLGLWESRRETVGDKRRRRMTWGSPLVGSGCRVGEMFSGGALT
jgi:hypothetical protein